MILQTVVLALLALAPIISPSPDDPWAAFVTRAAAEHGEVGARAAEFLAAHRPSRDADIDLALLLENLDFALRARAEFPWTRGLPEEVFFNDVLPYAVFDETRERWRPEFYRIAREIVRDCKTASEAGQKINNEFFGKINVHYNTNRRAPNQSPSESIEQGRATCTGLSIILVDACRAVGVPARGAGVYSWYGKSGNHTWVEIWDGEWGFAGADEADGRGLNHAWFVGDAARAVPGDRPHAVWATSWRRTDHTFPMAWNAEDQGVQGVDVTQRYVADAAAAPNRATRYVRLWDGEQRVVATVRQFEPTADLTHGVWETRAGHADLNDMVALTLLPGREYRLDFTRDGATRHAFITAEDADEDTLDLRWSDLSLSREDAEAMVAMVARQRTEEIVRQREAEMAGHAFIWKDHTMRVLEKEFGEAPDGGRSLWISMHGGGGAPAEVNDQQWKNQIRLYTPEEGIYIAPRAPSDTWNLWHQGHIDPLLDRIIESYVALRGVNPDRVYLMGYSAGGDGVYQLAPRMADRFAAASMMAGHPNETSPLGLRNLPFAIFMGGQDGAYRRNQVAASWGKALDELAAEDEGGYPHRLTIYPECGHWMDGQDAEALPWMAARTRTAWPRRVVWHQDDVVHNRFYWLAVPPEHAKARATVRAIVEGQSIRIETTDVTALSLRLRDELVDLDQPIHVSVNGADVYEGRVARTEAVIRESMCERADPPLASTARLDLTWDAPATSNDSD